MCSVPIEVGALDYRTLWWENVGKSEGGKNVGKSEGGKNVGKSEGGKSSFHQALHVKVQLRRMT